MDFASLNADILSVVFTLVERDQDVLSFALTCKSLWTIALPRLLADVHLVRSTHQIRFSHFILRDPSYGGLVHGLSVASGRRWYWHEDEHRFTAAYVSDDYESPNEVVRCLCSLIRALPHLRHLSIMDENTTSYYRFHPDVIDVICGCTSLVSLNADESTNFVHRLKAPLTQLTLRQPTTWNVLDHLANFTDTLEELTLQVGLILHMPKPYTPWRHLRHLTLWFTAQPLIEVLENAFPALESLSLEGNTAYDSHFHSAPSEPHKCTTWTRLSRLCGHVGGIYTLSWSGLSIHLLDINEPLSGHVPTRAAMETVGRLQPTLLRLIISAPIEYMLRVKFAPVAACLTALDIEIRGTPEMLTSYMVDDINQLFFTALTNSLCMQERLPAIIGPARSLRVLRLTFMQIPSGAWKADFPSRSTLVTGCMQKLPNLIVIHTIWPNEHRYMRCYRRNHDTNDAMYFYEDGSEALRDLTLQKMHGMTQGATMVISGPHDYSLTRDATPPQQISWLSSCVNGVGYECSCLVVCLMLCCSPTTYCWQIVDLLDGVAKGWPKDGFIELCEPRYQIHPSQAF